MEQKIDSIIKQLRALADDIDNIYDDVERDVAKELIGESIYNLYNVKNII